MELFEMLLLWAHMQGGHLDTDMASMASLETPIAAIFVVLIAAYYGSVCNSSKKIWKIPRQNSYWDMMQETWNADERVRDSHWQAHYRMSYRAFQTLLAELSPFMERNANTVREPIETERAVAMVLHRLAFGLPSSAISTLYNVGPSTVTEYTKQITEILGSKSKLYSKFVGIPTGTKLANCIAKFENLTDIRNICGAIDGTHIKLLRKPRLQDTPKFYWNNKKFYSILLQGVCDADKVFWDVCCNAPGGLHDSIHLRASSLWGKLKEGRILEQPIAFMGGRPIRPFLVGDTDYPIMPFLITPFSSSAQNQHSSALQNEFDAELNKAHACIESAFGILKKRWGILTNMNIGLQYTPQVVIACCVLHNFCQLAGEREPEDHTDIHLNNDNSHIPPPDESERLLSIAGRSDRAGLFRDWAEKRVRYGHYP
ncbi:hypothetical protein R1flu_002532 [Riccia fluitans]|uniref:DDE Tnp4 domain-containing protein n=1 Tax=Riccia fluitans TaxID=41844 RepID=A0ABD1Y9B6_9MARC